MQNSDELYKNLSGQAIKHLLDSDNGKNGSANNKAMLAILGVLIFVGVEAVRVFLRKNFGAFGISLPRLIICSLCFAAISVLSFTLIDNNKGFLGETGSPESYLVIGIAYALLAIILLVKGLTHRAQAIKANRLDDYRGNSNTLSFLAKDGWKQQTIQNLAEPLFVITLGILVCFYNVLGGLPFIFCGLSVWAFLLIEIFLVPGNLRERAMQMNRDYNTQDNFTEVK